MACEESPGGTEKELWDGGICRAIPGPSLEDDR
jgi:hypothetical protein